MQRLELIYDCLMTAYAAFQNLTGDLTVHYQISSKWYIYIYISRSRGPQIEF